VSRPNASWIDRVYELAETAPQWMRERASAELHIGGFTQARLETPVLEISDLEDVEEAAHALIFFLAVAAASGSTLARVRCGRGKAAERLVQEARSTLGGALDRMEDENVSLMRYFDVFLRPADTLSAREGTHVADALCEALDACDANPRR